MGAKIYRAKRRCDTCGEWFIYYRFEGMRGRSPSRCSMDCWRHGNDNRTEVPLSEVPPEWLIKLFGTAKLLGIELGENNG
jgi:hypothetical protein